MFGDIVCLLAGSAASSFIGGVGATILKSSKGSIKEKIAFGIGAFVVSEILGDICSEHVRTRINETKQLANSVKNMAKDIKKEDSEDGGEVSK